MKNIILIALSLILVSSCKTRTESQGSADELSMNGKFAKGTDTLKVDVGMEGTIDFDISASNEAVQTFVFNTAELFEYGDEYDKFMFKDSSEYSYQDLIFTYTYSSDTWKIEDLIWKNKLDSSRQIDLSGTYKRAD